MTRTRRSTNHLFNPSKKKQKSIRDKTPSNSTSDPHKVEEIIVEKPEKLPEPLEERLKLYKNNQTGEDVMKNKELNTGSSMFGLIPALLASCSKGESKNDRAKVHSDGTVAGALVVDFSACDYHVRCVSFSFRIFLP